MTDPRWNQQAAGLPQDVQRAMRGLQTPNYSVLNTDVSAPPSGNTSLFSVPVNGLAWYDCEIILELGSGFITGLPVTAVIGGTGGIAEVVQAAGVITSYGGQQLAVSRIQGGTIAIPLVVTGDTRNVVMKFSAQFYEAGNIGLRQFNTGAGGNLLVNKGSYMSVTPMSPIFDK